MHQLYVQYANGHEKNHENLMAMCLDNLKSDNIKMTNVYFLAHLIKPLIKNIS